MRSDFSGELKKIRETVGAIQSVEQNKRVIYTAITGDMDVLNEIAYPSVDTDYICFTDNRKAVSQTWNIVQVDFEYRDPRRLAKIFKLLPHRFLMAYEKSIWVDGNIEIIGPIEEMLEKIGEEALEIAFFRHPTRNCLYSEALTCVARGKDRKSLIMPQIAKYRACGFPENYGLIFGGVIFRCHMASAIKDLMELWWAEIDAHSVRDQISFNYCAYALDVDFLLFNHGLKNSYVKRFKHSKHQFFALSISDKLRSMLAFIFTWFLYLRKREL